MQPLVNIADKAARRAGDIIIRALGRLDTIAVNEKSQNDFVTEIDTRCEEDIITTIRRNYPDHAIVGEETGTHSGHQDEYRWIIDPLDGTYNFMHGFPHFAVSIAVEYRGRIEHGLIYDPFKQEVFAASRGEGATLGDRRIRVSQRTNLEGCLLATGLPYRVFNELDNYLRIVGELGKSSGSDPRRFGSAALDLAYVACGRLDGYWESGLAIWDMAAGSLIAREAGALIGDFIGSESYLNKGEILVANPKIFKKMLQIIRPIAEK